ncbi:MAG: ATP-binding cassette domain-containing protein [Sphingomonadales bacterium]|nr:ATP-binding cassette domain-containing protein [Sphingomonadales bacterium]MBD3773330.1 ATP-binding cassette domain-containing protein [Paracoccaceae bacterium]
MSVEQLLAAGTRRQRRALWVAILLAVLAALAAVLLLGISGWFLTGAALAGLGGTAAVQAFNYLIPSAAIRGLAIVRTAGRYGERLFSHRAALHAIAHLRPALFLRLAGQDAARALLQSPGEIATQLGADLDALEDRVVRRVAWPSALAAALAGLAAATLAGLASALALWATLAAMRLASRRLAGGALPGLRRQEAAALGALRAAYADYAAAGTDIAIYGLTDRVCAELQAHADRLDAARLAIVRREALVAGVLTVLAALGGALVLAFSIGPAPLAALAVLAASAALEAWAGLSRSDLQRPRIAAALERLAHFAEGNPADIEPVDNGPARLAISDKGTQTVLHRGERLRIGGPSGAGKTRLLETILGLRSDAPQTVETAGLSFAYVPQGNSLIAGTIADNLRMARPGVAEADMWRALDAACVGDVVRGLPAGLEYWLSSDLAALSGGQRRRVALARALLAGRDMLVLDEPTEGLDPATEARLTASLEAWLDQTGSGLLLVSHRHLPRRLAGQVLELG